MAGSGTQQSQEVQDLAALTDQLRAQNHALARSLKKAADQLQQARSQLQQMAAAPLQMATFVSVERNETDKLGVQHATATVMYGGRPMIVPIAANLPAHHLHAGAPVALNEHMVIVSQREYEEHGPVRTIKQLLDNRRLLVQDSQGAASVIRRSDALKYKGLSSGQRIICDASAQFAIQVLPQEDDGQLLLEEVPNITFDDIGGLDEQIDRIRDAVQLPYQHRSLYRRYELQAPKGVLLYGPPGNGKTMIAKAVAHMLDEGEGGVFLSVKGPELLNKFVGESERLIRLMFARARERASSGRPVIVFIDEMDSLLRTRGSGVSSDVETTIVPQFLAELDGVEKLDNVIVIGASNRIDMIDPAVLRPGRLDVKIRVNRPNETQSYHILDRYITHNLPLDASASLESVKRTVVNSVFNRTITRKICDIRVSDGSVEPIYFADIISGAMLKNIVDRAKTQAVKASIMRGTDIALTDAMFEHAVDMEYRESLDAVNVSDPRQWARLVGLEKVGDVIAPGCAL